MNRFEREIRKRGTINGRRWGYDRRAGGGDVSQRFFDSPTTQSYFPGHWSGRPDRGFAMLARAGATRRRCAALPLFHTLRAVLIRQAWSEWDASRTARVLDDQRAEQDQRLGLLEAAE